MNREMGLSLRSWVSDIAMLRMIRGSSPLGRISRRKLVFGRLVEILTMMQSCASAAKLRAAGPIFQSASEPVRITASRHSDRQFGSALKPARAPNSSVVLLVPVNPFQPVGRKTTPSSVSPVLTNRQSAMSSLRARATIIVLRVPARRSAARAWYHRASALSF
jgi:hypothetical protein